MASIQAYERKFKRSGRTERRYRAFDRDPDGRQVARVFPTRRDAQAWLDGRTHDRLTGSLASRRAGRITFRALWDEVHRQRIADGTYAPATIALHNHVWKYVEVLADRSVGDIDRAMVAQVLGRIERPVMREKARLVLSAMFTHAIDEGRITVNPARRPRRRNNEQQNAEPRGLDADQLRRLVEALPERYRALARLMAHVGLRPGEAYALTVAQVGSVLTVDRSVAGPTKTKKTRTIPLPTEVTRLLADHIVAFSDPTKPDAPVFTSAHGGPVAHSSFRHLLAAACRQAAIDPVVTPNDLRHTAAAFAIGNGADVYAVQRMLGHAKPSITLDVYGHLWDGSLERLAERLDVAIRDAWR